MFCLDAFELDGYFFARDDVSACNRSDLACMPCSWRYHTQVDVTKTAATDFAANAVFVTHSEILKPGSVTRTLSYDEAGRHAGQCCCVLGLRHTMVVMFAVGALYRVCFVVDKAGIGEDRQHDNARSCDVLDLLLGAREMRCACLIRHALC